MDYFASFLRMTRKKTFSRAIFIATNVFHAQEKGKKMNAVRYYHYIHATSSEIALDVTPQYNSSAATFIE